MVKYRKHKVFKPRKRSYKIPQGVSMEETEVANMVALEFPGTPVYRSDRQILNGREIDIYLPSKKLGIEFDGLYYHSANDKTPGYHLGKTLGCERRGIRLIHIFSDEWEMKKPLVIDLIRRALGKQTLIDVKDCRVLPLTKAEGKSFLDRACLLGNDPNATDYKGIFYETNLIAVMSYKKGEILRYCEARTIRVKNGLAELIKDLELPLTYRADRRFDDGWEFKEAGFLPEKAEPPKIYYTKDFKSRVLSDLSRMTEKQAEDKGYTKIYDCGDLVYVKSNSQ